MSLQKGLVHTVFFWLNEPENKAHQEALAAGLNNLAQIELIQTAFIGTPAPTDRPVIDNSYSFSITFIFKSNDDQMVYQTHPDHYKFIDACSHLWKKVQVYDAIS